MAASLKTRSVSVIKPASDSSDVRSAKTKHSSITSSSLTSSSQTSSPQTSSSKTSKSKASNSQTNNAIRFERTNSSKRNRKVFRKNNRPAVSAKSPKLLAPDERSELILSNLESAGKFAWALLNKWRITLPIDEVQSISGAALCEAASRFDTSLGVNFKTFFFYHLRGLLLKDITRRVSDQRMKVSSHHIEGLLGIEEAPVAIRNWPSAFVNHENPENLLEQEQVRSAMQHACESLEPLAREIVIRCFVNGESVSAIARELGYCRCHISRVKTKALRDLQTFLKPIFGNEFKSLESSEELDEMEEPTSRKRKLSRRKSSDRTLYVDNSGKVGSRKAA